LDAISLLSRRDAAQRVGLAPATLAKLAVFGGGPPMVKLGRSVRYRVADLEAWIERRTATSTTDAQARGLDRLTSASAAKAQRSPRA